MPLPLGLTSPHGRQRMRRWFESLRPTAGPSVCQFVIPTARKEIMSQR